MEISDCNNQLVQTQNTTQLNFQLCLKAAAEVKKLPNKKKAPVEYLLEVFPVGVNLSNSFQLLEN